MVIKDPQTRKNDFALDWYLSVMKIVSIDRQANIARITYAPRPNKTKNISEIHAPSGPPKFKIS